MNTSVKSSGGQVAIRGLLVQTLVALLDIAAADPPFTEITLEPNIGDEQFDFLWKDADGLHATQVKSTVNSFTKAEVERWAKKLQAARTTENCRLMLVGNIPPSLDGLTQIGAVVIEKKNLHLGDLLEQAAHRLAKFLAAEEMGEGTADEREMVVHALVSRLEHLSTSATPLNRDAFIRLLAQWIRKAPGKNRPIDISRIDKYAPTDLIGRESETQWLNDAWDNAVNNEPKRPHVLTFVALGGEGKTSLVAKWAADLAHCGWPGCDTAFAWSFYSQGTREQMAASSDLFLKEALDFFGDSALAASAQSAHDKGRRLAQLVGARRALLILDGVEPLQYAPTAPTPGELKDQGITALLKGLAATSHGLTVVTTRYAIPDLRNYRQTTAPMIELKRLSTPAGVALLKALGVEGQQNEFETLTEDVKGHALALNLIGSYLRDAHGGDIRKRDLVKLAEADAEEQGGHAFRVMDAYVQAFEREGEKGQRALALLRLLGLFDRPADAGCLAALLKPPAIPRLTEALAGISEAMRNLALTRLESAKLLTVNRDAAGTLLSLDAHPLLREYFAVRLREQQPDAWRAGHRRLYEHLCANAPDKPDTLEGLQPLYQAVAHGCLAELQEEACNEVYIGRILRGEEFYSMNKLGALGADLGAVTCFFDSPWHRVSPALAEATQAWLLNEAAIRQTSLGRLNDALEPMRVGLAMRIKQGNWSQAAISAYNLSELELTLGEVAAAVMGTKQSVSYAERCGEWERRMVACTAHADALHHAGYRAEAEARFHEAETMQAEVQPGYPLLYSLQGSQYCDLLLAAAERDAWLCLSVSERDTAAQAESPVATGVGGQAGQNWQAAAVTGVAACRAVAGRAAKTLKWAEQNNVQLLDIALDQLTVGRAALYEALLERSSNSGASAQNSSSSPRLLCMGGQCALTAVATPLNAAVDGLRCAGQQDFLPRGLLTRAWYRTLTGATTTADHGPNSAQSDLDEAWEIAERGPMPLFMADIHLYRARLFFGVTPYPWQEAGDGITKTRGPKDDLADARRLIEKHGYWRRKEELEDAEAASVGWPG